MPKPPKESSKVTFFHSIRVKSYAHMVIVQADGVSTPSGARSPRTHRCHSFMVLASLLSYPMLVATHSFNQLVAESLQTAERAAALDLDCSNKNIRSGLCIFETQSGTGGRFR